MESLVGISPAEVLLHGPSKRYIHEFLWHQPQHGVVGCYKVEAKDVVDHFGVFRGVDQIEAFAQATIASCGHFLEAKKKGCDFDYLKKIFIPTFISVGQVNFHHYLLEGETLICIGFIKFYKFRQMVCDGRIYKAPENLDLKSYFKDFNLENLKNYNLPEDFKLVAEIYDITGRAIKR